MALQNPKHQKIAHLLAQGFKPAQVATIVGCTPALLSQLAKQESFKEEYEHQSALANESTDLEEEERLNNKYLAAEHLLLDSITGNIALMEDREKIKALDVVAARQEKRHDRLLRLRIPQQGLHQNNLVQLFLPAHAVPEYQVNSQNEIIAIGQQLLAPMSSNGVQNLFRQMIAPAEVPVDF